jgi:hypothetical protein
MAEARAFCLGSETSLTDAESVLILPVECSLEVDETMEMMSPILVTLSRYVVLCTKSCDNSHKDSIWPPTPGLREGEEEVTTNEAGVISTEPFTRRAVARVGFEVDMGRGRERVRVFVVRVAN